MANYVNSDVPVRFDVLVDDKPDIPIKAVVNVFDPDLKWLTKGDIKPKGSEITYVLKKSFVNIAGSYTFEFRVYLKELGEHGHTVKVKVSPMKQISSVGGVLAK